MKQGSAEWWPKPSSRRKAGWSPASNEDENCAASRLGWRWGCASAKQNHALRDCESTFPHCPQE
eukprot:13278179-Alexandrium_andersonii.AAC.1